MDNERNEGQAPKIGQGKPRKNLKKFLLLSLLATVVLILALTTGMLYTSQPSFCLNCHEMDSQVASWSNGPHEQVTCLHCHSNPGTIGYVTAKVKGLREVYLHLSNQVPEKIVANVNPAACLSCHTGNSKYPQAKNIKLESGDLAPSSPHAQILKDNTSCLSCHQFVGHGQPNDAGTGG